RLASGHDHAQSADLWNRAGLRRSNAGRRSACGALGGRGDPPPETTSRPAASVPAPGQLRPRSVHRRTFLASALGATVLDVLAAPVPDAPAAPPAALAQRPRVHRPGALPQGVASPPGGKPHPLRVAMGELGYVVGQNLALDVRWAGGQNEHFAGLAAELVALK